jgi:hypothetical protein
LRAFFQLRMRGKLQSSFFLPFLSEKLNAKQNHLLVTRDIILSEVDHAQSRHLYTTQNTSPFEDQKHTFNDYFLSKSL